MFKSLNLQQLLNQFGRYLIVGVSSALIELGLFWLLFEALGQNTVVVFLGISLVISNVIAIALATAFNFILSYKWTFKASNSIGRSAFFYVLLFVFNQIFSSMAIVFLIDKGMYSLIAKMITMGCIVLWNFFLYRRLVFNNKKD